MAEIVGQTWEQNVLNFVLPKLLDVSDIFWNELISCNRDTK